MASRKTSRPPPQPREARGTAEPSIYQLYPEDAEQTGSLVARHVDPQRTIPAPALSSRSVFPSEAKTVRHVEAPAALEGDDTEELPNLAATDEIPNLAGEDGTSTDQTALMADLSVRTGGRARLSVLTGLSAGQVIPLDGGSVTLGRGKEATVVLRDPGVSRVHLSIKRTLKGAFELTDLRSTNGVRVNGVRVTTYTLRVGDRVQLGPELVLQFAYLDETEDALNKQLYEAATRDPLTQALNRRSFDERLAAEFAHARRHRTRLSIVLCDIDHFKRVNDKYGHPTGDRVLREFAKALLPTIRTEDVFARYGGEEFILLVRGESREQTKKLAERLRAAVKDLGFRDDDGHLFRVTLSAGVAVLEECGEITSPEPLIALADQRLYRAKQAGRDRVCGE